jgi:uncharacterized membrane protein
MRPLFLIPILVIVPFIALNFLSMVTGDLMSAVVFGLTIFVTVASWFSGRWASGGKSMIRS